MHIQDTIFSTLELTKSSKTSAGKLCGLSILIHPTTPIGVVFSLIVI
jgi:hypothetical protein